MTVGEADAGWSSTLEDVTDESDDGVVVALAAVVERVVSVVASVMSSCLGHQSGRSDCVNHGIWFSSSDHHGRRVVDCVGAEVHLGCHHTESS